MTTSRPLQRSRGSDQRPGELDQPCSITISAWRSMPGSPGTNRPRTVQSPASSKRSRKRIASDGLECDPELCFVDDGYSGDILVRPGLERLRDQAAAGVIDRLYILDPDRISRKYAYQVLILEELTRCGVEVVFLRNPPGRGPEENLLLQVQGMIAEYERAKIMERCRRGKQYAARHGSVNVLSGATYGYRYVGKHEGDGEARYQVVAEEARVVRKIFEWVGQERCSIGEVCRRLQRDGVPTRTGKSAWDRSVIWSNLKNPAYKGTAAFGKTRAGALKPQRLRPQRGRPEQPRRPVSRVDTSSEDQIFIDVPGLVSEELFGAVQAQLEENRQRRRDRPRGGRYLLQGLVVCKRCGYGCYGKPVSRASAKGKVPYAYYRCTGSDAYRFGGQRLCWNKQIRTDILDAAVWEDVRHLLSEPERVRTEYERRLQGPETGPGHEVKHLSKMITNVKKMISRLIDAYGDGLLDKSEFEPRILAAQERLAKLEDRASAADRRGDPGSGTAAGDRPVGGVRETRFPGVARAGLGHATGGRSGLGEEGRDRRAGGPHRVSGQSIPF